MSQSIFAYLGCENGKLVLCASAFRLNKLSPMHLRGNPQPQSVVDLSNGDQARAVDALREMARYYEDFSKQKKKTKK